jgi:hypothetical protein
VGDQTRKERFCRRLEGLKQNRKSFEDDAREIASLALPARSRFLATDTNKGRQRNRRLNNSHGIKAFSTLQGGMTSGLSSESRPWFSLTLHDDAVANHPEVKQWLGEVERLMYAFIAQSNLYGVLKTGYLELGAFGTEASLLMENRTMGAVGHALTFGEYWLGLDDAMRAGALYRLCPYTVVQAVGMFGLDAVSPRVKSLYDASNYDEQVNYFHAIEQNDDYVEGRLGPDGHPWLSVYWEEGDSRRNDDALIQLNGFYEQPFWAPRWDTTGNDAYGQGPGHNSLPDLRELQLQTKRKAEATDLLVWPELINGTKAKVKRQPKSVVNTSEADASQARIFPTHEVRPEALNAIREDAMRLEQKVDEITFADLFLAITSMQGIQPRNIEEIAARNEEKMTLLGPVIERVNNEKLKVVIDRVYGVMNRAQMFPPAPETMRNSPDIKVEFVSILTQMQRMVGLGQIERTVNFVGTISAVYPEARFKIDPMATVDEYASRAGAPLKIIRSTEDAEGDAEQEQQQAQAAQAAEMAPKISQPFKDMTDAAKVAADIPGSGIPPVQDLVPLVPR